MDIEKVKYNGQECSFADTALRNVSANFAEKSDFGFYTDEYGARLTTVSGNVIDANWSNYATNDDEGNIIAATYAKKTDIPSTDGLMQESLLSYNGAGNITAYNGSQFVGGGGGEGKTYNASTPDYIAVDNDNNTIGLTESPIALVAGNGLETSTEGDNVTLNVTYAPYAGEAANVQCNNGLINYEATNEDRTGFYVGNYLGNVEVRIADHDKGDIEQWYWDKSGIGCRETKDKWGYYSKLTKDDLQFTTDGGYTPSMSFKQLWDEVHGVVLFEGNVAFNNEIPLTESYKHFEKLVIVNGHNRECTLYTSGITDTPNQNGNALFWHTGDNVNADKFLTYLNYSSINDTTLIATFGTHIRFKNDGTITITTNSSDYNTRTFKVIGYGRKG